MEKISKRQTIEDADAPVRFLDSPLWLWPVLYAASRDVAVETVRLEGQVLSITLHLPH